LATSRPCLPEGKAMIECKTRDPGRTAAVITIGAHVLTADLAAADGGDDAGPSAHDLFDASLAACKVHTAVWYARRNGIPLEAVEVQVARDASKERQGEYKLSVRIAFRGPLDASQRKRLLDVAGRCPITKLMTTSEVVIETTHVE